MKSSYWNEDEEDKRRRINSNIVPKKAGMKRCGKSCRLSRSTRHQKCDTGDEIFTPQEEEMIIKLHATIGSRWPIIAQQLPGRTENDVKNHWNTKIKKKLTEKGIDPVTHRPLSQILTEYGNLGCLPRPGTRSRTLNQECKNALNFIQEPFLTTPEENSYTHFGTNQDSSSYDLFAQIQAITLVAEASKNSVNEINLMQNDCPSSTSSSSSLSSFSWRDYLVEDTFLTSDQPKTNQMLEGDFLKQKEMQIFEAAGEKGCDFSMKRFEASSSLDCSFVDAMVDRQNEMLLDCSFEASFLY